MERIDRAEGYPYMTEPKKKDVTLTECLKKCVLNQNETIRQLKDDKLRLVEALLKAKMDLETFESIEYLLTEMEAK